MKSHYRVGTRGSRLALTQSQQAVEALMRLHPGVTFTLITIKTTGDKIADVPLASIGDKGLFVKEIEQALLDGEVDLAIHSMKDMPTQLPPGLRIGCVPERKPPYDCLILREGRSLGDVPAGGVVGTGSLRRRAQLAAARPDLAFVDMRGNLPTRLAKLGTGEMAATVLALAGLLRLDSVYGSLSPGSTVSVAGDGITYQGWLIPPEVCVPAVGQGALCIECCDNDPDAWDLLDAFNHAESHTAVQAERGFMRTLEGGCQIPAGACATLQDDMLSLDAVVCSLDGLQVYRERIEGLASEAEALGEAMAHVLLDKGGRAVMEAIRRESGP